MLEQYSNAAYSAPSHLLFGDYIISSQCGVQQGDPLGPLLFSLAVSLISHSSLCQFSVWFLNDSTVGGNSNVVSAKINRVREAASLIDLELNASKCEAVSNSAEFLAAIQAVLPGCKRVSPKECELLGAPLCSYSASNCIARRTDNIKAITPRLASIDRHDALLLLRSCFGHPKLLYCLRAGPCFNCTKELEALDLALAKAFESGVCRDGRIHVGARDYQLHQEESACDQQKIWLYLRFLHQCAQHKI